MGDVAIELHRECECTLMALIGVACSSGHEGGGHAGRAGITVMNPNYRTEVRDGDVGVFIGANRLVRIGLGMRCRRGRG